MIEAHANGKITLQDFKPESTSLPIGRAVIGGKSAGDQRSPIFMSELLNASKRLADASPTPDKYLAY